MAQPSPVSSPAPLPPPPPAATACSSCSIPSGDLRSTTSLEAEELRILITNPDWEDELQLATHQPSTPPESLVNCLRSVRRLTPLLWAHPVKTYCGVCLIALGFALVVHWLGGGWKGSNYEGDGLAPVRAPGQRWG